MQSRPKLVSVTMEAEPEPSDEALVVRAQAGDRAALGALVRRHQRAVHALCLRYVRDADEAADLVQRAFVRVMAKLGELRDPGVFRSWLLRIGAHLALNHIRDNARFVSEDEELETGATWSEAGRAQPAPGRAQPAMGRVQPPMGIDRLEVAEAAGALREAVRELPTKQRMTLELRVYEDLSFKEIAVALGISEGAAKVNFHYAVRKLRTLLSPAPETGAQKGKGR